MSITARPTRNTSGASVFLLNSPMRTSTRCEKGVFWNTVHSVDSSGSINTRNSIMENPALLNPLTRFAGLADRYAKYRPSYPAAAIDFILVHCGLGPQSVVVDVGCGTGISSRLLAERGVAVIGIEPNTEMRRKAESEPAPPGAPGPSCREGRAEATNLPANIADAVLAAQAF